MITTRFRSLLVLVLTLPFQLAWSADVTLTVTDLKGEPLENASVSLHKVVQQPSSEAATKTSPSKPLTAIMDQQAQQFIPYVLTVQVDTLVRFPNSDNIRHHVYSFSPAKRFELRLYHGTTADPIMFDEPGRVVLGCNIHDSMLGYIYVVDSPWHGTTTTNGSVTLDAIPAGEYQLQIQSPRLKDAAFQNIHVRPDSTFEHTVTLTDLQSDPRSRQPTNELEQLFQAVP
ncbi:methylamine utilization protein [Pseudomaricurvus sp.]|uniref:methylamine utilization protein n=1 Tax=Pseudomaricurvus sp. TaxID=2004510 RepID=UPI003F6CF765